MKHPILQMMAFGQHSIRGEINFSRFTVEILFSYKNTSRKNARMPELKLVDTYIRQINFPPGSSTEPSKIVDAFLFIERNQQWLFDRLQQIQMKSRPVGNVPADFYEYQIGFFNL